MIAEFTRQHLAFRVERRMGAADVVEILALASLAHGALRADNGPEFIARALKQWASEHDTLQVLTPRASPGTTSSSRSLHNCMRDELLDDTVFDDVDHARKLISAWFHRYNEEHPHSTLGWLPPNTYARQ